MKDKLEKKIEHFIGVIQTRFEREHDVDINVTHPADIRHFGTLSSALKSWIGDYTKIKESWDATISDLVGAYLLNKPNEFEVFLAENISAKAIDLNPNRLKDYINSIAMAIAYQKFFMKAVSYLIETAPNT